MPYEELKTIGKSGLSIKNLQRFRYERELHYQL